VPSKTPRAARTEVASFIRSRLKGIAVIASLVLVMLIENDKKSESEGSGRFHPIAGYVLSRWSLLSE
jgi:hypothetical protein